MITGYDEWLFYFHCKTLKFISLYLCCFILQKQAKSRSARQRVEGAMSTYQKLVEEFSEGDIPDKAQALKDIRRLLRVVEEGVNLPCQEYFKVANAIATLYRWSFNIPKMKKLFVEKSDGKPEGFCCK